MQFKLPRPLGLALGAFAAASLLSACATGKNKGDTHYVARDVSTLYNSA